MACSVAQLFAAKQQNGEVGEGQRRISPTEPRNKRCHRTEMSEQSQVDPKDRRRMLQVITYFFLYITTFFFFKKKSCLIIINFLHIFHS